MSIETEHQELLELLPFYVNGTLNADQRSAIDLALERSSALRAELASHQNLAHIVTKGGVEMTENIENTEERLEAVLGQLEDKAPATTKASTPPPQVARSMLAFLNPRNWHPAVSLALALGVITQGLWIGSQQHHISGLEYQLASGPEGEHHASLMIQLKDEARWADVQALLGKEGLRIVGGPNEGALSVSTPIKGTELDALIMRLRASPLVAAVDKAA